MGTENHSTVQAKEIKFLFTKERFSITKNTGNDFEISDLQTQYRTADMVSNTSVNLDEYTSVPNNEFIQISIWKYKQLYINRSLIPLRLSMFLWFASGSISSHFLSLMLKGKGLKVEDFSFVFSMIFFFQMIVSYSSGIVADKLGSAKHVLLFQMLIAIFLLIGLLLSPTIEEKSCTEHDINTTCLQIFNFTSDLEYCKYVCSKNTTDYFLMVTENNNTHDFITFRKKIDTRNSTGVIMDEINTNKTIISCYEHYSCTDFSIKNGSFAPENRLKLLYAVIIWFFISFWSTSYRFLDYASLNVARKHNSDFGSERVYGILGTLVATTLCNFLLNVDKSKTKGYYDSVYWLAIALYTISLISAYYIDEVICPPGLKLTKKTLKLFADLEIMSLFFIAFVAGCSYTFNTFYHLWFLDSLDASKIVIGFHAMTSSLYGLPIYLTSKWWIKKLGMKRIVIIGLLNYSINGICYSFLNQPWLSLIIQLTKAFSFHLFWVAAVTYGNKIAPEGLTATVNAVIGAVHFGIGRSFSVSVGGHFISIFGIRTAYRILAGFCLVSAVLYATLHYLRHLFSNKETKDQSKDAEEMKSMNEEV